MRHRLATSLGLAVLLAGCGTGGGDGGSSGLLRLAEQEANDSAGTANGLPRGRAATGDLSVAGDIDFWSFAAQQGEWLQIELFATRFDQTGWDAQCNVPQLTLFGTDGVSRILEHAFNSGWDHGRHDMDFPVFRVPQSGTYYVCVTQNASGVAGGDYALTIRPVAPQTLQFEDEPGNVTGQNDGPLVAETIAEGMLFGRHLDGDSDYYKFTTSGASVVVFELLSYRNGLHDGDNDYFHPELRLYAPDGGTLLASAGGVYFGDPLVAARLSASGTYFIEVRERSGSGDAAYYLSFGLTPVGGSPVETEPNDQPSSADGIGYGTVFGGAFSATDPDVYAFAGTAGDMVLSEVLAALVGANVTVQFLAPDGTTQIPSATDTVSGITIARTILTQTGTHYMRLSTTSPGSLAYHCSFSRRFQAAFETESNDTTDAADSPNAFGRTAGTIGVNGDVDMFRFSAEEGQLVVCSVFAARADAGAGGSDGFRTFSGYGSLLKPRIRVLAHNGTPLATSVFTPLNDCCSTEGVVDGLPCVSLAFFAPSRSTFYLEVTAEDGTGSSAHRYTTRIR